MARPSKLTMVYLLCINTIELVQDSSKLQDRERVCLGANGMAVIVAVGFSIGLISLILDVTMIH